jgi:hypothetical protein
MAATYSLISSTVLTGSQASVTFSSIPQSCTDLVIRCSMRGDRASNTTDIVKLTVNDDGLSIYSDIFIRGDGAAAISSSNSAATYITGQYATAATSLANTFSSFEYYIPSYTTSQARPVSGFFAHENNTTTAYISSSAGLYAGTSAITSLTLAPLNGSFVSGSSFYLYGISKS